MHFTTTKTLRISIHPTNMSRLREYIHSLVEDQVGTCDVKYGYITGIERISACTQRCISRISGNCVYDVQYTFTSVKPEIGDTFNAIITRIFEEGIFVRHSSIEMLIPTDTLVGWTYIGNKCFQKKEHKEQTIRVGNWVDVLVTAVEYTQHRYICICKLKLD